MKECYKCRQLKDEIDFYKNKTKKDGLQNQCKECFNEYYAIPEVKQKRKEYRRKYYNRPDVKARQKRYREEYIQPPELRAKKNERLRICRKHPEVKQKRHEEYKKYFAKPGVRQKHLEQQREYAAKPEAKQIKKENTRKYRTKPRVKQRLRENAKRYYAKPESQQKIKEYLARSDVKQKRKCYSRHRRLKKKQLFEDFTCEEWKQKVDATDGSCPLCGRLYTDVYPYVPTLDHTVPVSKTKLGYCYTIADVTPMCGSCNSSKSNSF